jgi:ketosteroid isomerase-like protein
VPGPDCLVANPCTGIRWPGFPGQGSKAKIPDPFLNTPGAPHAGIAGIQEGDCMFSLKASVRTVRAVTGVMLMSATLMAGAATKAGANGDEAKVASAVETMRAAMVASDGKALDKLVEKELTYGHSSGKLQDRAAFIKDLDGTNSFKSVDLSKQSIDVVGDNAVVRHTFDSVNNLPDGKTTNSHIGVLQVWKKHPQGWRLLARQAYLLPKE